MKPRAKGQGRKPLNGNENMQQRSFRATRPQLEKLDRLGGSAWIRRKLDEEKEQ